MNSLRFDKETALKIFIFVGLSVFVFLISLSFWPSLIFRDLSYFQINHFWSKSFVRLLFGPITPFLWQIKQLLQMISNYGLSGISIWFGFTQVVHTIGGSLYIYGFYRTGKTYFRNQTKWNNWKIILLIMLFSLFWFFWGESHISFGV